MARHSTEIKICHLPPLAFNASGYNRISRAVGHSHDGTFMGMSCYRCAYRHSSLSTALLFRRYRLNGEQAHKIRGV
jgi:hypothetical protein